MRTFQRKGFPLLYAKTMLFIGNDQRQITILYLFLTDDETVCCRCQITNTGNRAGAQTIQLYVGIPEEGQPKKQLRAFKKVALAPQETKHVSLCLEKKDFATYNCKNQAFVINKGTYSLWIGTSVKDIFFQSEVTLSQSGIVK